MEDVLISDSKSPKLNTATFAFNPHGLFIGCEGIEVVMTPHGYGVILGNEDGHLSGVAFDSGLKQPIVYNGKAPSKILSADSVLVQGKNGTSRQVLIDDLSNDHVLVVVKTGHHHIKDFKQEPDHGTVELAGKPVRIAGGFRRGPVTPRTKEGHRISEETLWRLQRGDKLLVVLTNREKKVISFNRKTALLEDFVENKSAESTVPEINSVLKERERLENTKRQFESSMKQAKEGVGPKNRDGGRYGALRAALELQDNACLIELGKHVEDNVSDMRIGFLREFVEMCPDTGVLTTYRDIAYDLISSRERHDDLSGVHNTLGMKEETPEGRKNRAVHEAKKAERRDRDRQLREETRGKSGGSPDKYGRHGKKEKKK